MNGQIQRTAHSVQLAVMATPTRSLDDALAAARRGPSRPTTMVGDVPAGVAGRRRAP